MAWVSELGLATPLVVAGVVFGLTAATVFAALVVVSAVISVANVPPVQPFLDN
jgi:hypothetical protein